MKPGEGELRRVESFDELQTGVPVVLYGVECKGLVKAHRCMLGNFIATEIRMDGRGQWTRGFLAEPTCCVPGLVVSEIAVKRGRVFRIADGLEDQSSYLAELAEVEKQAADAARAREPERTGR